MAKSGGYLNAGWSYVVNLILAIIPVTSWILGAITAIMEGRIVAGILRILLGWGIIWLIDLILMIVSKRTMRLIPC